VLFSDDNFATNPRRAEDLCDRIIAHGIRKTFVVQTRIDIARHPRLLDKAWQAGFRVFLIGVESPHDRILKQLNKGITQQQIRDAFAVLTRFNFWLHGYFIYGNISETEEEMLYIPKFAKEIKCDSISFQKLRVEKFSPPGGDYCQYSRLPLQSHGRLGVFGSLWAKGTDEDQEQNQKRVLRCAAGAARHRKSRANQDTQLARLSGCDSSTAPPDIQAGHKETSKKAAFINLIPGGYDNENAWYARFRVLTLSLSFVCSNNKYARFGDFLHGFLSFSPQKSLDFATC